MCWQVSPPAPSWLLLGTLKAALGVTQLHLGGGAVSDALTHPQ